MSNTDLVARTPRLPRPGETIEGYSFATFAGGKGANQAVAAARAGAKVRFCGASGDDAYGTARRRDLQEAGVDTSGFQEIEGEVSGVAVILVDDAGENQIVTAAGANHMVDIDQARSWLATEEYDLVMMTWDLAAETHIALLDAIAPDAQIVLNIAPYHESAAGIFPDERLIVVCNEVESGQLLGIDVTAENAGEAAKEIVKLGCRGAVITLGRHPAVATDGSTVWVAPPPAVEVVDTTGAGDTFCGAFSAWLAGGATIEEALFAGVHAGSLATTVPGAQPSSPRRDAILASLERVGAAR